MVFFHDGAPSKSINYVQVVSAKEMHAFKILKTRRQTKESIFFKIFLPILSPSGADIADSSDLGYVFQDRGEEDL